jgi:hypothetical protein
VWSVEQDALDALQDSARQHRGALRRLGKIALVIANVETFLDEVWQGDHDPDSVVVRDRAWVYTVPQDFLGGGGPDLDVRVIVGTTRASLFHVSETTHSGQGAADLVSRDAVAQQLIESEDQDGC